MNQLCLPPLPASCHCPLSVSLCLCLSVCLTLFYERCPQSLINTDSILSFSSTKDGGALHGGEALHTWWNSAGPPVWRPQEAPFPAHLRRNRSHSSGQESWLLSLNSYQLCQIIFRSCLRHFLAIIFHCKTLFLFGIDKWFSSSSIGCDGCHCEHQGIVGE